MKKDPYAPYRSQNHAPTHWRSLEHKSLDASVVDTLDVEFPSGLPSLSRRDALKISGASIALGLLQACNLRRPEEGILPFVKQPEGVIPGLRVHYATAMMRSEGALGLLVETHEGRPTKIEGNPKHPSSLGASDVWAQAEILKMYDPDRARSPMKGAAKATWAEWDALAKSLADKFSAAAGKGLFVLTEVRNGPTFERLLAALAAKWPEAKVHRFDPLAPVHATAGAELAFGPGARVHHDLETVQVLFSLDSDFLTSGPEHLRHARAFGKSRAVNERSEVAGMKRLYVSEGAFTPTGSNADHRVRVASSQQADVLLALAATLREAHGVLLGAELDTLPKPELAPEVQKFVAALAKDIAAHRGKAMVLVGERQPPAVHALGSAINLAIATLGASLKVTTGAPEPKGSLAELVKSLDGGEVDTLLVFDANPVYTAPGALEFEAAMGKAKLVVHAGVLPEETAAKASWHLPSAHFLECWGDAEAWDGTASIIQPLIHPLHGARASTTLLAQVMGETDTLDKTLVEITWRRPGQPLESDRAWRRAVHDGVIETARPVAEAPGLFTAQIHGALGGLERKAPSQGALELVAFLGHALDGRLANVSWIMELPDGMSKLCWDNAVLMAPSLAKALGVQSSVQKNKYVSDLVELTADGRKIVAPTFVLPGLAPFTLAIARGFGRKFGHVATDVGADVHPLLAEGGWVAGVSAKRTGATVELCSTQDHFSMPANPMKELTFAEMSALAANARERKLGLSPRPHHRSVEADEFAKTGDKLVRIGDTPKNLMEPHTERHLPARGIQPTDAITYEGQQWGMTIDLSSCIGCSACTIACVAENNIPAVGKEQVMLGREMHWIRIDRYFAGDVDQPTAMHQPLACMHCENAPCEPVCPVSATVHDEEGVNSMAYNRCVGTRYCANNCPFKVRRFNYLDYTHTANFYVEAHWAERMKTLKLQRNPDVTVRYRGIMEKCSYCTQRIEEAKISAKRRGEDRKALPDGAVVPACVQACPTQAITFGNVNDPNSRVHKLKIGERNYELLQELNVRPRTTYLARIKNENEELA